MEEGVDLGIRIGQLKDSSFQARKLSSCQQLICASPIYLQQFGTPKTMDDLVHHQGLIYSNIPEGQLWNYKLHDGAQAQYEYPADCVPIMVMSCCRPPLMAWAFYQQ